MLQRLLNDTLNSLPKTHCLIASLPITSLSVPQLYISPALYQKNA